LNVDADVGLKEEKGSGVESATVAGTEMDGYFALLLFDDSGTFTSVFPGKGINSFLSPLFRFYQFM
jgi:hypothetical protein